MNPMKQLMEMKKKAESLQKQLEAIKIEKTNASGSLTVCVNGAQRVERIHLDGEWLTPERKEALEQSLVEVINSAFGEAQKKSASQAASLMTEFKGLNIPGL